MQLLSHCPIQLVNSGRKKTGLLTDTRFLRILDLICSF
jgi:hypothetical protein